MIDYIDLKMKLSIIIIMMCTSPIFSSMPNTQNESITSRVIKPSASMYESIPTNVVQETKMLTASTTDLFPSTTILSASSTHIQPSFKQMVLTSEYISTIIVSSSDSEGFTTTQRSTSLTQGSSKSCAENEMKLISARTANVTNNTMVVGNRNLTQQLPESEEIVAIVLRVSLQKDVSEEKFKVNLTGRIVVAYDKGSKTRRKRRELFGKLNIRKIKNRFHRYFIKEPRANALKNVMLRSKRETSVTAVRIVFLQRRSKTSEQVDVHFVVYVDNVEIPAYSVIQIVNKLTHDELADTLGYPVLRNPFLPSKAKSTQTPPQREALSQRALVSAILIPVTVLVVLMPCLLINTERLSWKCLRRHNHVEPIENATKEQNMKNTVPKELKQKRKSTTEEQATVSPPVPATSPISSKLLQTKEKQVIKNANNEDSKARRPSLAQSILLRAKQLEEVEMKQENNFNVDSKSDNDKSIHDKEEIGEKKLEFTLDKSIHQEDGMKGNETTKTKTRKTISRSAVSQSILLYAKNEKENKANENEEVKRKSKRNVSRSILLHAKELKKREIESMGKQSSDVVNSEDVGIKKRRDELDEQQQTCAAVVEMFSKFSNQQLVRPSLPRPPMTRAWTLSEITRPNKEIILSQNSRQDSDEVMNEDHKEKEGDDLILMALAERTKNKQLQKRKSEIPLGEIKKALKNKEKMKDERIKRENGIEREKEKPKIFNSQEYNDGTTASWDFLRKRNKRISRWRNRVNPIDEQVLAINKSTDQKEDVKHHSSHGNVTQQDVTQQIKASHASLNDPNEHQKRKNANHKELLEDHVLSRACKSVTQSKVTQDSKLDHSDHNRTRDKLTSRNDVTQSGETHNIKKNMRISSSKEPFNATGANNIVTQFKKTSRTGDNVTQHSCQTSVGRKEGNSEEKTVNQGVTLDNAQRRLSYEEEMEIDMEARHLVERVLFRVCLEG